MFLQTCTRLKFSTPCTDTLVDSFQKIHTAGGDTQLELACDCLTAGNEEGIEAHIRQLAERTEINRRTITAVVLIRSVERLKKAYANKGWCEDLMWDTLVDIKCKLDETYALHGVWGTGAIGWYLRIYTLRIIKLGRLEFEPIAYKWDTPYRGIQKGDPVMNMHIPSTGPMKIEDVLDSFKRAYKFFGYTEPMPVAAASWLLYPPVCETVFKEGSNLKNFYDLFDVVEQYEDPDNKNFWRIFNMKWEAGILDKVPLDTSLRRGLYEFMKLGRDMGVGRCMLLFDGEKVITNDKEIIVD